MVPGSRLILPFCKIEIDSIGQVESAKERAHDQVRGLSRGRGVSGRQRHGHGAAANNKTPSKELYAPGHEKTCGMNGAPVEHHPDGGDPDKLFGGSGRCGDNEDGGDQADEERGQHRLGDPPGGGRPERFGGAESLSADFEIGSRDAKHTHHDPVNTESTDGIDAEPEPGGGGEDSKCAELQHDRSQGPAVDCRPFHESPNDCEMLGGPVRFHWGYFVSQS